MMVLTDKPEVGRTDAALLTEELHGRLDLSFKADYKMSIRLWQEQLNNSAMFLFHLLPRVPLTPLDPPWSIFLP